MDDVLITELEKIDATRVDGVDMPANGIPILLMKGITGSQPLPADLTKDWADWDAAHEGGSGGSNAGGAAAVAEARQTQAQEKDGKKPDAAELHNAHEVHVAHEEHEEHLHAEHESHVGHHEHETHEEHEAAVRAERGQAHPASSASTTSAPKAPTAEQEAKDAQLSRKSTGGRNCPKCGKSHDADHKGNTCEKCGADLPAADGTAKSVPDWHADAAALVKKAITRGKVNEQPDIEGGVQAIGLLGKLIGYEAQELAAGHIGEIGDIQLLTQASSLVAAWLSVERAAQMGDTDASAMDQAQALMQSAAKKSGIDTAKSVTSEVAEGATAVNTEPQGTEGLSKEALDAAVTKAMAPLQERITALDAELAKVKATPIPGGPLLRATQPGKAAGDGEDWTAKAAYYRAQADAIADPRTADGYRQLARQADDKANATS